MTEKTSDSNQCTDRDPWKNEDILHDLYVNQKLTVHTIGDQFGVSGATISYWLKKFELPVRNNGRTRDSYPWRDADLMKRLYVDERLSTTQIGKKFDCTSKTVSKWLDRHGIDARSKKESNLIRDLGDPVPYQVAGNYYPAWRHTYDGDVSVVAIHRLLAVAEFGYDAVVDKHVHHKNSIRWDNRTENIGLLTPSEHARSHYDEGDLGI